MIRPVTAREWSNLFSPLLAAQRAFPAPEAQVLHSVQATRHSPVGTEPAMAQEWSNPSSRLWVALSVFPAPEARALNSRSAAQCPLSAREQLATERGPQDPYGPPSTR